MIVLKKEKEEESQKTRKRPIWQKSHVLVSRTLHPPKLHRCIAQSSAKTRLRITNVLKEQDWRGGKQTSCPNLHLYLSLILVQPPQPPPPHLCEAVVVLLRVLVVRVGLERRAVDCHLEVLEAELALDGFCSGVLKKSTREISFSYTLRERKREILSTARFFVCLVF